MPSKTHINPLIQQSHPISVTLQYTINALDRRHPLGDNISDGQGKRGGGGDMVPYSHYITMNNHMRGIRWPPNRV